MYSFVGCFLCRRGKLYARRICRAKSTGLPGNSAGPACRIPVRPAKHPGGRAWRPGRLRRLAWGLAAAWGRVSVSGIPAAPWRLPRPLEAPPPAGAGDARPKSAAPQPGRLRRRRSSAGRQSRKRLPTRGAAPACADAAPRPEKDEAPCGRMDRRALLGKGFLGKTQEKAPSGRPASSQSRGRKCRG